MGRAFRHRYGLFVVNGAEDAYRSRRKSSTRCSKSAVASGS
jgi:hypothetical protein